MLIEVLWQFVPWNDLVRMKFMHGNNSKVTGYEVSSESPNVSNYAKVNLGSSV
jgi:hypothetical protein